MLGLRPVRQILDKLDAATSSVTVKLPEFLLIFAMKTMWVCFRRPIVVFVICARGSLSRVQSCPLEPRNNAQNWHEKMLFLCLLALLPTMFRWKRPRTKMLEGSMA